MKEENLILREPIHVKMTTNKGGSLAEQDCFAGDFLSHFKSMLKKRLTANFQESQNQKQRTGSKPFETGN